VEFEIASQPFSTEHFTTAFIQAVMSAFAEPLAKAAAWKSNFRAGGGAPRGPGPVARRTCLSVSGRIRTDELLGRRDALRRRLVTDGSRGGSARDQIAEVDRELAKLARESLTS
jgi:hypothetical protein